jgi:hypothetical protein
MNWALSTGEQKWSAMRGALVSLVNSHATDVRFGLAAYPSDAACGIGALYADVDDNNSTALINALNSIIPAGGTPTHTTLQGALGYYQEQTINPDGRYVLLATDGEPNCGDLISPHTPMVTESVAAIEALAQAGIPTFVLGFGADINSQPQVLQAMATAGGTSQHYAANSPQELSLALDQIASEVSGPECEFILEDKPSDPTRLRVFFDGEEVGRSTSHADGFDYEESNNSIIFYGPSCDRLQSGQVSEIKVDYGCYGKQID